MEVRRGTDADGAACRALWGYCFEKPGDPFFEWFFRRLYRPEDVLLAIEGGRCAAALHLRPYTVAIRGRAVPVRYIVGVAVHPAARGRGVASALLREAFRVSRAEGCAVDILMPSDTSLYRPLGFGMYAYQWEREAAPERIAPLGQRLRAGLLEDPSEWGVLAALYRAHTVGRHGYALRDEANWRLRIEGQLREGYIAVVEDEEGPAGYLAYTIDGRTLLVSEMVWSSEAGRRGLYAYLAGHRGSVDLCRWYEPLDDRSYLFWADGAEHTYIRNRTFPYMAARVTDPGAAFSGLTARGEGEAVLFIDDPTLPEAGGAWTIAVRGGRTETARGGPPDLRLTAEGAAHLLLGALPPSALFAYGEAVWLTEDPARRASAAAFLDGTFPAARPWINEWY